MEAITGLPAANEAATAFVSFPRSSVVSPYLLPILLKNPHPVPEFAVRYPFCTEYDDVSTGVTLLPNDLRIIAILVVPQPDEPIVWFESPVDVYC